MLSLHIAFKEIKELFRDKKNLILNILFPLIMIIAIASISAIVGVTAKKHDTKVTIEANAAFIKQPLLKLSKSYMFVQKSPKDMLEDIKENRANMGIVWDKSKQKITFIESKDNEENPYNSILKDNVLKGLQISLNSKIQLPIIEIASTTVAKNYTTLVLKAISVICSYVMILLVMRINNANAYYLTTKEKSSGTLEVLLMTPLRSLDIALGKWISNFVSCYSITIIIFLPLYLGFVLLFQTVFKLELDLLSKIPILLLILFGFAAVFSLVQLVLGFAAESAKKAQLYLVYIPLLLCLPLTVCFASDIKLLGVYKNSIYWLDFIPIINFYDFIQMSILSIFNIRKMLLITTTNILVVIAFLTILVRALKEEKILFFKN
ncbi:ABC transporter permease subunit [Clostridium estertheticum]|uniref:ABC transporter permease subunit n=1 Tax=Clostridium estertheticum TaxID=238834 RepID=UPI001C0A9818|nr:ABC transporter permease subunit [Clostridium estertheticum]MBU3171908.1 ABC transporter permease [Clostridium estertheticum]